MIGRIEQRTIENVRPVKGVKITTPPYLDSRVDPSMLIKDGVFSVNQILNHKPEDIVTVDMPLIGQRKIELILHAELGKGAAGTVRLGQNIQTGEWVAVKTFHSKLDKARRERKYKEEIEILTTANALIASNEEAKILVMKLLPGVELDDVLNLWGEKKSQQKLSLLQKIAIAKDAAKRLAGFHKDVESVKLNRKDQIGMLHRDIKPGNMVLDAATMTVSICDLGNAAKPTDKDPQTNRTKLSTRGKFKGTYRYTPPEHFDKPWKDRKPEDYEYDEATEVYELGVSLAQMLGMTRVSHAKFRCNRKDTQIFSLKRSLSEFPKDLVVLIKAMMQSEPQKRPGVIEVGQRLNRIHFNHAKIDGLNVCTLSIREFLLCPVFRRSIIIRDMIKQNMNVVSLTALDTDIVSLQDYYQVRYELMKAGIVNVSPFMATSATQIKNIRVVKDHYDAQFATPHTKVFHYCAKTKKIIDRTPSEAIKMSSNVLTPEEESDFINKINNSIGHATETPGIKTADRTIIEKLPKLLDIDEFIAFLSALEEAYQKSLKAAKAFLGPKVTEATLNKAPATKYVLPRALGLLLRSVYVEMEKHKGSFEKISRSIPGVYGINDVRVAQNVAVPQVPHLR